MLDAVVDKQVSKGPARGVARCSNFMYCNFDSLLQLDTSRHINKLATLCHTVDTCVSISYIN